MAQVIIKDCLKRTPDKVKAGENMPKPTCKKETLSLQGFINYLAKFLLWLSEVAQPLRDMTVANAQSISSEEHDKAFDEVKKLVTNYPVLKYYDIKTRLLCIVMSAKEVLVRHSFRTGNQLLVHHEHCLQLNKDTHR